LASGENDRTSWVNGWHGSRSTRRCEYLIRTEHLCSASADLSLQECFPDVNFVFRIETDPGDESFLFLPITYHWTVPLILDHSYLVGKLTC
jgi:hypothetical protein